VNGSLEILVDGMPGEVMPSLEGSLVALGSDPLAAHAPDPFVAHLDRLRLARGPARTLRPPRPPRSEEPADEAPRTRARSEIGRLGNRAPRLRTPRLAQVELPAARGLVDRLLSEDERKRVAAIASLVEGGAPYDRYGFSPEVARRALPAFLSLYRLWFRVRSSGHENLPTEGPAILVGNHAGLLPFDGAMGVVDVLLHTDPPRLARAIVDRWAGALPWVNVFFARAGQVIGTRENVASLLEEGQLVLIFPEGMEGIRKRVTQRYRLQSFHVGFVEAALRAGAPIVPVAFLGTEDQAPILYDLKPLARWLGLPVVPITPTFPWLGPLGLLPYPVRYRIVYGEPLRFHERFGPEGAGDVRLVRYLANQVRRSVQLLVDRNR
jgi:1-acyl-sn-glycerol-3-phosphate acyltransferase